MTKHTTPTAAAFAPSDTFRAGRDMPAGSIGYHVDCSDNPYDLRPAADVILQAIDQRRKTLPAGTKLVVLMGEIHVMPTHLELQHMVISRLHNRGENFTVNFERQHNNWATSACKNMDFKAAQKLKAPGYCYDPDGRAALSATMTFVQPYFSPISNKSIWAFCYSRNIKTAFNDVEKKRTPQHSYLSMDDPLTARVATEYLEERDPDLCGKQHEIETSSPSGMAIRNRVMAHNALDHARVHNAPLILQSTGAAHVFGAIVENRNYCYQDSLSAVFEREGAAVLPVFITVRTYHYGLNHYGLNILPQDARSLLPQSVVIDGLAKDAFDFFWSIRERAFLKKIHAASGHEIGLHTRKGQWSFWAGMKERSKWKSRARSHAEEILAKHAAAPEPQI